MADTNTYIQALGVPLPTVGCGCRCDLGVLDVLIKSQIGNSVVIAGGFNDFEGTWYEWQKVEVGFDECQITTYSPCAPYIAGDTEPEVTIELTTGCGPEPELGGSTFTKEEIVSLATENLPGLIEDAEPFTQTLASGYSHEWDSWADGVGVVDLGGGGYKSVDDNTLLQATKMSIVREGAGVGLRVTWEQVTYDVSNTELSREDKELVVYPGDGESESIILDAPAEDGFTRAENYRIFFDL